jgi:hypothetical protein
MTIRGSSLAIIGSIAAHVAAFSALVYTLVPVRPPNQLMPESRVSIAAQQVKRTTAPPSDASGEIAAENRAAAPAARQNAVPQTSAPAATITADRIAATNPDIPAAQVSQQNVQAAQALPPSTRLTTAELPESKALASAAINSIPVADADITSVKLATSAPAAVPAAKTAPDSAIATNLPLPSQLQTASLAWSGASSTTVSAASLTAIAAFSQQGDLSAESQHVRDGIADILSAVPCARLQAEFDPDTGGMTLTGHIPEDALRGPVLSALRAQVGDAIALSDTLLILPRPQCGALAGIADAGLPQSTEQLTNPRVIGANGFAQNYTYSHGQALQLDLSGPDYDSYVYVDYFVADGTVVHLQPNDVVPVELLPAKAPLTVGRVRGDKPFLQMTVSAPFGQEIAAAFATSTPLYYGLRPVQEPAGPYLAFIKEQVALARAGNPAFKGEWVYFFVTTKAH